MGDGQGECASRNEKEIEAERWLMKKALQRSIANKMVELLMAVEEYKELR